MNKQTLPVIWSARALLDTLGFIALAFGVAFVWFLVAKPSAHEKQVRDLRACVSAKESADYRRTGGQAKSSDFDGTAKARYQAECEQEHPQR